MSKFTNSFLNYITPLKKYFWVFLLVIIFVSAAFYGYNRYAKSALREKMVDIANGQNRNMNADVYFFHVDWCPHCKTAKPEWDKFEKNYNGKSINGYTIVTHNINCTDDSVDTNKEVAEYIQKFNIQGYPTIKVTTDDGKTIDFESRITEKSLETFINNVL